MAKLPLNLSPASARSHGGGCSSSTTAASLPFTVKWTKTWVEEGIPRTQNFHCSSTNNQGGSYSTEDGKSKVIKELGLFSLRKKIEDAVLRAEALAPAALELEEARRIRSEELIRELNLWDDPTKSSETLVKLADSSAAVAALKEVKYKVEEAKLIAALVETDAVNHRLFKQAYNASEDVSKFLDQYEMTKLLNGPFDKQGASLLIKALDNDPSSQIWAESLLNMYLKWAEKQGRKGRITEKNVAMEGGINSATVDFEFKNAYGHLVGERGAHHMIGSSNQQSTAVLDITPLSLEPESDLLIEDEELIITYGPSSERKERRSQNESLVSVHHLPTGISVQSSGERSRFANKMKALNLLKAKLRVLLHEQGISSIHSIRKDAIFNPCGRDVRRYTVQPSNKLVRDLLTGIQIRDVKSVLDGNIELLIAANVSMRHSADE